MTTEELEIEPLSNVSFMVRPGIVRCCGTHTSPVLIVWVLVGNLIVQLVIPVRV